MTEVAKAKKEGTVTTTGGNPFAASNFLRQFRDKDSRELQQLSAAQFMKVWEHYDEDGKTLFYAQYYYIHFPTRFEMMDFRKHLHLSFCVCVKHHYLPRPLFPKTYVMNEKVL